MVIVFRVLWLDSVLCIANGEGELRNISTLSYYICNKIKNKCNLYTLIIVIIYLETFQYVVLTLKGEGV